MAQRGTRRSLFSIRSLLGMDKDTQPPAPALPEEAGQAVRLYPVKPIGKASSIARYAPLMFTYPDAASPCLAVRLDKPAPGGVGPGQDIVAYSTMCPHMGCILLYEADGSFRCDCHFSRFDAEKGGQMICGQATRHLPRICLQYDAASDMLQATGIEGLLYGRPANTL